MKKNNDNIKEVKTEPSKNNVNDQAISTAKTKIKNGTKLTLEKLFKKNSVIKIVATAIAVVLWLYVSIYVDPDSTKEIKNILVSIDQSSTALKSFDLVPVNFGTYKISLTISGDNSELRDITPEDFIATFDLSPVTTPGTYSLDVNVKKVSTSSSFDIEEKSIKPLTFDVEFDSKAEKTLAVSTSKLDGINAATEYIKREPQVSPTEITIFGPKKEIDKVSHVEIDIPDDLPANLEDTYTLKGDILLKDVLGETISSELIEQPKTEATVTIPVQKVKTIELLVNFTNVPSYILQDSIKYKLTPSNMRIVGDAADIDKAPDSYVIGHINLGKMDISTVKEILISQLPDGTADCDKIGKVSMQLDMENLEKASFTSKKIDIINYPSDYTVTTNLVELTNIQIIGRKEIIESLSGDDISVIVDMSDRELTPGKMYKKAKILIPDKGLVWAVEELDDSYLIPIEVVKNDAPG